MDKGGNMSALFSKRCARCNNLLIASQTLGSHNVNFALGYCRKCSNGSNNNIHADIQKDKNNFDTTKTLSGINFFQQQRQRAIDVTSGMNRQFAH